jgi:cytochrome c-type biogenesis protein CcmE
MTRKQRRLSFIGIALGAFGIALGLVLFALRDSIVFFYGPTELAEKALPAGTHLRVGGLVKQGSVKRDGQEIDFVITDMKKDVAVTYNGALPDLFREGQGVVAEGVVEPGSPFRADSILAKHDERYMPREVADALKKKGLWQEGETNPAAMPTVSVK